MAIEYPEGPDETPDGRAAEVVCVLNNGSAWREWREPETGEVLHEEMCDEEEEQELYDGL